MLIMVVYACQCLNPNSGDTGGILDDDWTTPKADKLGILHDIQPQPSRVTWAEDGTFRYHVYCVHVETILCISYLSHTTR